MLNAPSSQFLIPNAKSKPVPNPLAIQRHRTQSPSRRPKTLPFLDIIICTSLPVAALLVDLGAPPAEALHPAGVDEAEEDDHDAKGEAGVESRAEGHGVFAPPGVVAVLDEVVKDVADDDPDGEVKACGWRDPGHGAKDDWEVDFAEDAVAATTAVKVEGDGEKGTQREEPDEGAVDGFGAEELVWADDTPEDRAVEVDASDGAGEAIDGLRSTESLHVRKHPVENTDLSQRGHEGCDDLDGEENARGNLHVVAQLEIRCELNALG